MTTENFTFSITRIPFNEDYQPADGTRITTNFANLARGESRQENLRNTISMINNRFNDLAHWDNPSADRYAVELDIISVEMHIDGADGSDPFPLIEVLRPTIVDTHTGARTEGIVGNNFSSYVRDYDFSVVLPASNEGSQREGHAGTARRGGPHPARHGHLHSLAGQRGRRCTPGRRTHGARARLRADAASLRPPHRLARSA